MERIFSMRSNRINFSERKKGFQGLNQNHLQYTPFAMIHHENDFDFHQDTPHRRRWHFFLSVMEWAVERGDMS